MNIVNKLTLRHLRLNRQRTLLTLVGIMLSVAMVCAVAGFVLSVRDVLKGTIQDARGDYHIAYQGVTEETASKIAKEDLFDTYYTQESEYEGLVDLYLRLKSPNRNYWVDATALLEKYSAQTVMANKELLALEGVIQDNQTFRSIVWTGVVIIAIIVSGSVIVIANAFYISTSERVRQFGLLKSAGATSEQIMQSILFEAFVLAGIAIPLGIAFGFLIQFVVLQIVNGLLLEISKMNNDFLNFRVVFSPIVVYVSVAVASFTVLISAWLPARRAAKTNPIEAIRRTADIKIKSKQLKTSFLTQKLFGFEGTLAAKSLKRSRGKYRATVISLVISLALLISMSSLIWMMNKDVKMQYPVTDFNVWVRVANTLSHQEEAERLIQTVDSSEMIRNQYTVLITNPPEPFFNGQPSKTRVALIPMPDAEFEKLAPAAKEAIKEVSDQATKESEDVAASKASVEASTANIEIRGVLLNPSGSKEIAGIPMEFKSYRYTQGIEIPLIDQEGGSLGRMVLISETDQYMDLISLDLFYRDTVNILLPESAYREMLLSFENQFDSNYTNKIESVLMYRVKTAETEAFCTAVQNLFSEDASFAVTNIDQMTRVNQNIVTVIMLFGYGFIAMLSLIAVTSVVSTISTGMALRKQEFAMLYSAGMTPEGMDKMLNLESLLYGLKSLLIGLPVGLGLSYLIYQAMATEISFSFKLPLPAIVISSIAVLLLTFGTMRYGKAKMKKINIVEAIRSETI